MFGVVEVSSGSWPWTSTLRSRWSSQSRWRPLLAPKVTAAKRTEVCRKLIWEIKRAVEQKES